MTQESVAEFTAVELIAEARRHGVAASPRKITDWVELGLLDRPRKRGAGRGRGWRKGVWPASQLDLFLVLLEIQAQGQARRVATLCNLPVFLWLHDPSTGVPLRQVKRALGTWAKANGAGGDWSGGRAARHAAVEMMNLIDGPIPRMTVRRRQAIEAITQTVDQIAAGQRIDRVALLLKIAPTLGDDPVQHAIAEGYVRMLEARIRALAAITSAEPIPGELLVLARDELRRRETAYAAALSSYAANPYTVRLATPRTHADMANDACRDLLTQLGVLLQAGDAILSPTIEAPAATGMARGHGTETQEVSDAGPP